MTLSVVIFDVFFSAGTWLLIPAQCPHRGRQQLKLFTARAVGAPDQGNFARCMLGVQWPRLHIGTVEQSRPDRHFRYQGQPETVIDQLHQRMQ